MALQTRPARGRPTYDPYQRRVDLFVKAAGVLRTVGYRQVTMKALGHACGVSAPALYRYFASKRDFALFPLQEPPAGYFARSLTAAAEAHADPLRGFHAVLEAAVAHADVIALGVRLAIEAGEDESAGVSPERLQALDATLRDALLRCVPMLGENAQDLAHTLVSLVVRAGAEKAHISPEALWRQGAPVVTAYLRSAGIDEARLCEVFAEA